MQITPDEIMEQLEDDQMKHAEAPSDAEMEQMFLHTTQEEIDAENRKSGEREAVFAERNAHQYCAIEPGGPGCVECRTWVRENLTPSRRKFTFIGEIDRRDEALVEIERENVEASQERYQSY